MASNASASSLSLSSVLTQLLGLCGGGGEEHAELNQPKEQPAAPAEKVKGVLGQISSRVRSLAGVEAPDPEFDAAVKLLAEPVLMSVVAQGGGPEMARFTTSKDGSMLTWQSLELQSNMPKFSGAVALASITRVERPPVSGMNSWLGRGSTPLIAIFYSSPSEQLRVEVSSEQQRDEYASALDRVSTKLRTKNAEHKLESKMARHAQKEVELMTKRHAAEKRKAEILQSMSSSGGMKHTAVAMASRPG